MKVLVFDTETTGLPTERNASFLDVEKWPHIVQLSYVVYDTIEKSIVKIVDAIISVDTSKVTISNESIAIHGITPEICHEKGIPIKEVLLDFNETMQSVDFIIGHNISFDKRIIMVECIRQKMMQKFTINGIKKKEFCTMKLGTEICKLEKTNPNTGEKYFKFPTLGELYHHLFQINAPAQLHNAYVDVLVCLRCYLLMIEKQDFVISEFLE
jgi:DNA polymerase III epsilon subunit-like protein